MTSSHFNVSFKHEFGLMVFGWLIDLHDNELVLFIKETSIPTHIILLHTNTIKAKVFEDVCMYEWMKVC